MNEKRKRKTSTHRRATKQLFKEELSAAIECNCKKKHKFSLVIFAAAWKLRKVSRRRIGGAFTIK
jgi:hypothetical protein